MDFQIGLVGFDCRFHRGHHWRRGGSLMTLFYYGLVFRQQPLSELTMLLTKMAKKYLIGKLLWLSLVVSCAADLWILI
jgi:hypothetical protein